MHSLEESQDVEVGPGRTAVLLHGLFRTANITATSFKKNVSDYLDADLFYSGYCFSDKPLLNHAGVYDKFGFMKDNPKNTTSIDDSNAITHDVLKDIYESRLIASNLHQIDSSFFSEKISEIDENEILFQLKPSRFLSMFHNIESAYKLLCEHENKENFKYDTIVIARPDLAFYSPLEIRKHEEGSILLPAGMGFHPHVGTKNHGLVEPLFYKNALNGTCIPTGMQFNDQLMVLKRSDCYTLENLLSDCINYMKMRVPLTPETLLYYHFCAMSNLEVKICQKWTYEIFRIGSPEIENVTNLPLLERYDPHHPVVQERARKNKFKYFLKGIRRNFYFYKNKINTLLRG
ncbi:hypothetical protein [Pantoea ananatis]|uniref:hypothetical protein n=1 Tax=Pantoea ananas TaxID=553 RepID=UPI00092EF8FC|nr:hypothetical protein [Pantoea ananatis]UYL01099.1 hypothetical protein NG830_18095 [Pantoea ananatis]